MTQKQSPREKSAERELQQELRQQGNAKARVEGGVISGLNESLGKVELQRFRDRTGNRRLKQA
jgi:hypothetical protein